MSGCVIFLQRFADQRNALVRNKHVFHRDTGAPASSQADRIPVVQQRDLRYLNQCGTAIDELPGVVKDGNAQDVPVCMVDTTIKTPRSFLDQNPTIHASCLHLARRQHTRRTEVSTGKYFVDDVLWIKRCCHPRAGREQSNRPRRRAVPSSEFYYHVHKGSQRALQTAIHLWDEHIEQLRLLEVSNCGVWEASQSIRFQTARAQRGNQRRGSPAMVYIRRGRNSA